MPSLLAQLLARSDQLPARPLGERLHPDRRELVVGGAELDARVDAALLAAQPLPVNQMGAGQLRTQAGPAQPVDRLAVQVVRCGGVAQQRPAARLDAQGLIGAAGLRRLRQPRERIARELDVSSASGRLDELGQRPRGHPRVEGVRGGLPGRRRCLLVAGEAVVQNRGRPVRGGRRHPPSFSRGLPGRARYRRGGLGFPPLHSPEPERHVRRKAVPGRRRHAVDLRDERGGTREVADPRPGQGQRGEVDW